MSSGHLDIAMRATKLNVSTAASDGRRQFELEYQDWARLQGHGPRTAGGPAAQSRCGVAETVGTKSVWRYIYVYIYTYIYRQELARN